MTKFFVMLMAVAIMAISSVASANVLGDPGFEGSGAGPWITDNWGGPWTNNYDATDYKYSGSQSLKQISTQVGVDISGWEKAEAKQIFPVEPGYIINGGGWLKWNNLSPAPVDSKPRVEAFIECKWLDASKKELTSVPSGYMLGIGTEHKTSGSGDWQYQDLGAWTVAERTAPPGAAYVDYRLVFLSPGYANVATGDVWWDDAQFTIVPEPTSLLLLGSGLVGLLGLSRKKR